MQKKAEWQYAFALLAGVVWAIVNSDTVSCSAAISACEKAAEWLRAVALLAAMDHAVIEPNTICSNSACHRDKCGPGARQHQLQRSNQCL